MAGSLAIGFFVSSFVDISFPAATLLLVAALPILVSFRFVRKGWPCFVALCATFFLFGLVRAQLPDVKCIPDHVYTFALALSARIQHVISSAGLSEETESLVSAMLLGRRVGLSADTVALFRQTGSSHILALSGLHLSILFGVFYYCLLRVLTHQFRYIFGTLGLLLIWGYALVTDFPVSLCRASLMLSLLLISQMRMVGSDTTHSLGFAALLLLLLSPSMLYDIGFQLSFMAVAGLLYFYRPLEQVGLPRQSFLRWLWRLWLVSVSAQLGVLPLLLCYFRSISISGIFFSPIYVLLATAILYAALAFLLMFAFGLGTCLRFVLEGCVHVQQGLMSFASHLPLCRLDSVSINAGQVVLLYAALALLLPVLHSLCLALHSCHPPAVVHCVSHFLCLGKG